MAEITKTIIDENDAIVLYEATREVKSIGNTGHVTVPVGLIGKRVKIIYTQANGG